MTKNEGKKAGGGKLMRSEVLTVRLDAKLRYLLELAARAQRRTASSYVESAIQTALEEEPLRPAWLKSLHAGNQTVWSEGDYLWDVDEADRVAKLALRYPQLLTFDEQVLWKLVVECGAVWKGHRDATGLWVWEVSEQTLDFQELRMHWDDFVAVAEGRAKVDTLPEWPRLSAPNASS